MMIKYALINQMNWRLRVVIRLIGIVILSLFSFTSHSESMTDDLMSKEIDKTKYDISKDHFNSHRLLYRHMARSGVKEFVFWCFSGARIKNKESAFILSGLESVFKECFSELTKLKCPQSDSSSSCILKRSYPLRLDQAKLLEKLFDKDDQEHDKNKDKNKDKKQKKFTTGDQELSESCRLDIKKAVESSKHLMCTQALVPLTCPTGEEYMASNGCVGNFLIKSGWKKRQ